MPGADAKQLFACRTCGYEKWVPERPTDGKVRIRSGCKWCETMRTFEAVGRVQNP